LKPPEWWLRWRPAKTGPRRDQSPCPRGQKSNGVFRLGETPFVFFEGLNALRRGLFYASPLFEATVRVLAKETPLFEKPGKEPRLCRRISVKAGQVVPFAATPATGRIQRHFTLAGRGNGGEHVGTAASRAWGRCDLGFAVAHRRIRRMQA
jgi:hypothetical protein